MTLQALLHTAGGLALFLLAMSMMTDGLKVFAGAGLKRLLERWTYTPLRGVFAGLLVTGIVQSSSAVTIATIGFVNAGMLTLRQALGVIYGTNLGTTMTGWLVSVVGFGFRIESFALPILTLGVILRLMAPGKRQQGLGEALAGFGLFFLGLAILKDAFGDVAESYGAGVEEGGLLAFLLVGFVVTALTQSSSAAIAIVLTAAAGGVIGIEAAAAAVIGANLGTTPKAAIVVVNATPAAQRLAVGHIAFNVITAVVALALLPALLWLVARMANWLEADGSPAVVLALFHTVFNALGVAIMLPLSDRMARLLERLFRSDDEDLARPRHIDATLAATPELALAAAREELQRLRVIVTDLAHGVLSGSGMQAGLERKREAVTRLVDTIARFIGSVSTEAMPESVVEELARALNTARSLEEAARRMPSLQVIREESSRLAEDGARASMEDLLARAGYCVGLAGHAHEGPEGDAARTGALVSFHQAYGRAKEAVLGAVVVRHLSVDAAGALLDALSATRWLVEQLVKADRLLRSPGRAADIEAELERAAV